VCREAVLNIEANNDSMQGPDTFTRIKLLRQGVLIHELMEKRGYEMAKKIARYWTAEGQLVDTPDSKRLREKK
jgi:hypothetical protein